MLRLLLSALLLLPGLASAQDATTINPDELQIPHQRFVLDNGLTVIVHEDHAVPIVSVNVWFKVGSRDERPGRTGFAHLFEHFFFNGSENYPHGFREAMDDLGANNRNGTTSQDRTNFYEDVPVSALERTLYLEADRMGFLSGHISEAMLERERGVVKNEKRQRENQPYGTSFNRLTEMMYPAGHPYSWSPIGRIEDLDAATLDDVREWYATYYGPSNAVLVLAGDITAERARELAKRYFGPIKPGLPLARVEAMVPRLETTLRDRMQDRVPQTALMLAWHLPPMGEREAHAAELLASVLSGSDSARLDRSLRFEQALVTSVNAFSWDKQLASVMILQAFVQPDTNPARVEAELDRQIQRLIAEPPSSAELQLARSRLLAGFARSTERIGGRASVLANSETMLGDSQAYLKRLRDIREISAEELQAVARDWLGRASYRLQIDPFPSLRAGAEQIDRSQLPALDTPPDVGFPEMQRFTLDNGLDVLLMQRSGSLLVQMALLADAGAATDADSTPGTAQLAMSALVKGTRDSDVFALADRLDRLGARLYSGNSLDQSQIGMQALASQLDASLDLLAEVVREPAFDEAMVELVRKEQLASIEQAKADPMGAAMRIAPALLYGAGHPYGLPWDGLGHADSVASIEQTHLRDWHARWFVPGNVSLVVAGDVSRADLEQALRGNLARWKPAEVPEKPLAAPAGVKPGSIYLLDRPGAQQSVIMAMQLGPADGAVDVLALESVMRNFGGMATSRLNRNLRLDKHWSYGTSGRVVDTRGERPFVVVAPVQTDKTREAVLEVLAEIRGLAGERPVGAEEFSSLMRSQVSRLPARFETLGSLLGAGIEVANGLREPDYYYDFASNLRGLQADGLNAAAAATVKPDALTWIVIGDLARIEAELQSLQMGELLRLDAGAL